MAGILNGCTVKSKDSLLLRTMALSMYDFQRMSVMQEDPKNLWLDREFEEVP
jgi:hypothetical protein